MTSTVIPFACSVGGKRFSDKGHLGTHSGERGFSWAICGKIFSFKSLKKVSVLCQEDIFCTQEEWCKDFDLRIMGKKQYSYKVSRAIIDEYGLVSIKNGEQKRKRFYCQYFVDWKIVLHQSVLWE